MSKSFNDLIPLWSGVHVIETPYVYIICIYYKHELCPIKITFNILDSDSNFAIVRQSVVLQAYFSRYFILSELSTFSHSYRPSFPIIQSFKLLHQFPRAPRL